MPPRPRPTAGFTLIELMIVIAIIGLMVGLVMPSSQPSLHEQLRSVAAILRTDLAFARSLAVTNDSQYEITFNWDDNEYVLEHSGANGGLDDLPRSPFRNLGDPADQHIVRLAEVSLSGPRVRLVTAANFGTFNGQIDNIEFGPLGETINAGPTYVWLAAGVGSDTRYIWLEINPITGLAGLGDFTAEAPAAWLLP